MYSKLVTSNNQIIKYQSPHISYHYSVIKLFGFANFPYEYIWIPRCSELDPNNSIYKKVKLVP